MKRWELLVVCFIASLFTFVVYSFFGGWASLVFGVLAGWRIRNENTKAHEEQADTRAREESRAVAVYIGELEQRFSAETDSKEM